jgi:hypothetical protein
VHVLLFLYMIKRHYLVRSKDVLIFFIFINIHLRVGPLFICHGHDVFSPSMFCINDVHKYYLICQCLSSAVASCYNFCDLLCYLQIDVISIDYRSS